MNRHFPRQAPNDPPRDFFAFGYLLTEGQMLAAAGGDGDLRAWVKSAKPGDTYVSGSGESIHCERAINLEVA